MREYLQVYPLPPLLIHECQSRYLRRFKTLSRAFATGDFRIIPNVDADASTDAMPGSWQKVGLTASINNPIRHIDSFYLISGSALHQTGRGKLELGPILQRATEGRAREAATAS